VIGKSQIAQWPNDKIPGKRVLSVHGSSEAAKRARESVELETDALVGMVVDFRVSARA
jgi:hypothetical protein